MVTGAICKLVDFGSLLREGVTTVAASHWCLFLSVSKANLNIPMGALRPGAGLPGKRREESTEVRV